MNYKSLINSMLISLLVCSAFANAVDVPPVDVSKPAPQAEKKQIKLVLSSKLINFSRQVIGLFATKSNDSNDGIPQIDLSQVAAQAAENTYHYKPTHNWQPLYHSQVGPAVFTTICYPYGINGIAFDQPVPNLLAQAEIITTSTDPNQSTTPSEHLEKQAQTLEKWSELIHQWRRLNEAPVLATEVIHAAGLTRAQVRIYQTNPQLAVDIKRTLGRIAFINQAFDRTSRMVLRNILNGQTDNQACLEMEKQLADLQSLMDRLAETNDIVSIALGIGPINRTDWRAVLATPINYSHFNTQTVAKP